MRSREILPSPPLRRFVRLMWIFELDDPATFGPPERVLPDGIVELVFHYRTPLLCRYEDESFARQSRSAAISQTQRSVEILPDAPVGLISVRFQPWGAYHFLSMPLCEIADLQVPADLIWGAAVREIEDRLSIASGDEERVALVEGFLMARLAHHSKQDVEPIVREAWLHCGRIDVAGLCLRLGVGERTLQRTTAAALGTTPKRLLRLTRFLNACNLLRTGGFPLAEVALACGYYDQSHLSGEVKELSGMTPKELAARQAVSFLELD